MGLIDALVGATLAVLTVKVSEKADPEVMENARRHAAEIGGGVKAVGKLAITGSHIVASEAAKGVKKAAGRMALAGGHLVANAVSRVYGGETPEPEESTEEEQNRRVNEAVIAALEAAAKEKKERHGETSVHISKY